MASNWIRTNYGYINTNWIKTTNFTIYIHYKTMDSNTSSYTPIFGGRKSVNSSDGIVIWRANSSMFRIDIGSILKTVSFSSYGEHEIELKVNSPNVVFKVDSNQTSWTCSVIPGTLTSYLGNVNTNGSKDSRTGDYQIYRCKIWEGDSLVRDYVPSVNNGQYIFRDNVGYDAYTAKDGTFSGVVEKNGFWKKENGIWKHIYQL